MSRKARRAINRSHHKSIEENVNINYISDIQWSVPSFKDPDEVYMVEKNGEHGRCWPCEKAGLICVPCNVCGHSFSCTCPDYLIHDNICKHIHRVVMESTQAASHCRMKKACSRERVNNGLQIAFHQEGVRKNIEITNIFDNLWLIPSFTDINKVYAVEKNADEDCQCNERCEACNICIHSFSCTCPSSATASNICKHIHKVAWETMDDERSSDSSDSKSTASWTDFARTKLTRVERRHESSVNARVEVSKISALKHLVPSFTNANVVYTVENNAIINCSVCKSKDRCNYCNICVHSYSCTCPDHEENYSICKHIHKVACQKNIEVLTIEEAYSLDV